MRGLGTEREGDKYTGGTDKQGDCQKGGWEQMGSIPRVSNVDYQRHPKIIKY